MPRRRSKGEGTYYQDHRILADGRESKFWVYIVSLGRSADGRRVRRKFVGATKAEAKLKFEQAREKAGGVIKRRSATTVGEYLEAWLDEVQRTRSAPTYRAYAERIRRFAVPNIGKIRLDELDQTHLMDLYGKLSLRGVSPDNVRKLHRAIRRALNLSVGRGLLRRSPADHVELPSHKAAKTPALNAIQLAALLKAARGHRLEPLIRLGALLGLRPGEMYGLKWPDIDFEAATIHVERSLEEDSPRKLVPAKADSERTLPIDAGTLALLEKHREAMKAEKHGSEFVFVTKKGAWMPPKMPNAALRELCAKAEVPTVTTRSLRHGFISMMGELEVPIRVTSDIAGHADSSITTDVYSHATGAAHRKAVDKGAALVDGLTAG